jgi:hypothetical protein
MDLTLPDAQSVLALVTISSPLNLPPVSFKDSKARVTNNNSRVQLSPVLVGEARKPAVVAVLSTVLVAVTMTRVLVVQVL